MSVPVQLRVEQIQLASGQEWTLQPGSWRFVCLRSGNAYCLEPTSPRELSPGELLIVAPGPKGIIRASQLGNAVLDWFSFDPVSILGIFTLADRHWLQSGNDVGISALSCLSSTDAFSREAKAFFDAYSQDLELIGRAKAMVLALRLISRVVQLPSSDLEYGCSPKTRFEQLMSQLTDLDIIQRNSEELARICGCTPRHFTRMFRRRFGVPTRVRQAELRLIKARQLLEMSVKPVAQIASYCGYRKVSVFNALFLRRFGMSPSEWRKHSVSDGTNEGMST